MMVAVTPEMRQRVLELLGHLSSYTADRQRMEEAGKKLGMSEDPKDKQRAVWISRGVSMKEEEMIQVYFWGWIDGRGGHQL